MTGWGGSGAAPAVSAGGGVTPAAAGGDVTRRSARGGVLGGVAVLLVFVALGLLSDALATGPQGPASSSYATSARGAAAWAELLQRAGRRVQTVRDPLDHAALVGGATVVVLDPDTLLAADGRHLNEFVRAGGHLLLGGPVPAGALATVVARPPTLSPAAERQATAPAGSLPGVAQVRTAGAASWAGVVRGTALLRDSSGRPILLRRRVGAGTVDLLADPSPLQNDLLTSADNAALALDLAPAGAPVLFAESVHGFGRGSGLGALPARWRAALIVLALAGLTYALARGRRLGPPEATPQDSAPPRRGYVRALVMLLARTSDRGPLAGVLRRAIRRELGAHVGVEGDRGAAWQERALSRRGVQEPEVDAALGRSAASPQEQLLLLGRALAHLRGRR